MKPKWIESNAIAVKKIFELADSAMRALDKHHQHTNTRQPLRDRHTSESAAQAAMKDLKSACKLFKPVLSDDQEAYEFMSAK